MENILNIKDQEMNQVKTVKYSEMLLYMLIGPNLNFLQQSSQFFFINS